MLNLYHSLHEGDELMYEYPVNYQYLWSWIEPIVVLAIIALIVLAIGIALAELIEKYKK